MTLLLTYWALSALITHAYLRGTREAFPTKRNKYADHLADIIISITIGWFLAPFVIHKAIRFVFEYIDRSEG